MCKVDELARGAASLGMPAVAMTDMGNMYGAVPFTRACLKEGVAPILGAELWVAPRGRAERNKKRENYHLVLLVKDEEGYRNLCRLISVAWLEGHYYVPRVDRELLAEHSKGLIALTADRRGEVPALVGAGRTDDAVEVARWYAKTFGEDDFFIELQDLGWLGERPLMKGLREVADRVGLPTVATNHVHYMAPEEGGAHELRLVLGRRQTLAEDHFRFPSDQFFFKSGEQMEALFREDGEAVRRTVEIAQRCAFQLRFGSFHFPAVPLATAPPGQQLRDDTYRGLEQRLPTIRKRYSDEAWSGGKETEYSERLEHELDIIDQTGFPAYFLIVADFIRWAKAERIPVGPGRGSGAGSLVAYCLGITEVDPIPYDLLFERFLNTARVSLPDFDIDFCYERRPEVIDYVTERYGGRERVAKIVALARTMARGSVRDAGRALGMPLADVDRVARLVPEGPGVKLPEAVRVEARLVKAARDPQVARLLDAALSLDGAAHHTSVHAAGVILADDDLTAYVPLSSLKGSTVVQVDGANTEALGLVKFDFLGLRTLTQIDLCLRMLREGGIEVPSFQEFMACDLDSEAVFSLLQEADTLGVFQLESAGMRALLTQLRPTNFDDIVACVALYRPGPMGAQMHVQYADCKNGRRRVEHPHADLKHILSKTYGVIVYQEQIMQISRDMAGFSLGEADVLRKAVGKKDKALIAKTSEEFIAGCAKNGYTLRDAKAVWDLIEAFGDYGFNKSHSVAYGLLSYQTAWLKAHHRAHFFAALLTTESGNTAKVLQYVADCRERGLTVRPPDINASDEGFAVVDGDLVFGLGAIKGIGHGPIAEILDQRRSQGPFESLDDFAERMGTAQVNKRVMEALARCGAFDSLGVGRAHVFASADRIVDFASRLQQERDSGQVSLFAGTAGGAGELNLVEAAPWGTLERLGHEKAALGFYLTGHPLDLFGEDVGRLAGHTCEDALTAADGEILTVAGSIAEFSRRTAKASGRAYATFTVQDQYASLPARAEGEVLAQIEALTEQDEPVLLRGRMMARDGSHSMRVNEALLLRQVQAAKTRRMELRVGADGPGLRRTLEGLKEALQEQPGPVPVGIVMHVEGEGRARLRLPQELAVRVSPELCERLEGILGAGAVRLA
jgi:DNA polymerase-3 subunit alpha